MTPKKTYWIGGAILLFSIILYFSMGPDFGQPFMNHGHCFYWTPEILWTYVISNSLIGLSYVFLSFQILRYHLAKKNEHAKDLFYLFSGFILSCGIGHFIMVLNIWAGWYHLEALWNLGTCLISVITALVVYELYEFLLTLKTEKELRIAYEVGLAMNEVFLDAVVIHDGETILHINRAFENIFGYSYNEVVGSFYTKLSLFPEEEWDNIRTKVKYKVFEPYTATCLTKDGNHIQVIINPKETHFKGKPARVVSFRDITEEVELKRTLENLRLNQEERRTISELRDAIFEKLNEYTK